MAETFLGNIKGADGKDGHTPVKGVDYFTDEDKAEMAASMIASLPIATPETLGGVKPTLKTEEMTQSVGVDETGGLWTLPSGGGGGGIPIPETAEVGQTIVVKAVDENGKPTEWETASRASGEFPLIAEVILTEEVSSITIDTDLNGNPFELSEAYIQPSLKGGEANANASNAIAYWNKSNTATQRHALPQKIPTTSADTNIATNSGGSVAHYQKFKYGYIGPSFIGNGTGTTVANYSSLKFISSDEWGGYVTDKLTAFSIYCETAGYTFGVGTRIRIYGR